MLLSFKKNRAEADASSVRACCWRDAVASTAAFRSYILVGLSLYHSEAVIAFPCRAVVVGCSLRWPTAALPPIPHLSQTSVFPLFFIRLTFPCTALVRVCDTSSQHAWPDVPGMSGLSGLSRAARLTHACDSASPLRARSVVTDTKERHLVPAEPCAAFFHQKAFARVWLAGGAQAWGLPWVLRWGAARGGLCFRPGA